MAAALVTLDIPESQVLVEFPNDAHGLNWHHRILHHRGLGDNAGSWVWSTPDFSVQIGDLGQHRIHPLGRNAGFPAARFGETYAFDPITDVELAGLRAQAVALANIMGYEVKAPGVGARGSRDAKWRIADPACEGFGDEVPDDALSDPAACIVRDTKGLVDIDPFGWTLMEQVEEDEKAGWRIGKLCGAVHDDRLSGNSRDKSGRRRVDVTMAMSRLKAVVVVGTPHQGPSACLEFLESIEQAGQSNAQHHVDWRTKSGVSEKSQICRSHKDWSEVLYDMLCIDELNAPALVSAEAVVRKILQIETAVRRNPKQPDFEGLELLTTQMLDESGGATAPVFASWLSTRQRDEAQILKQGRLLREERTAEGKRSAAGGGGGRGRGGGSAADAV